MINKNYLQSSDKLKEFFEDNGYLVLHDFFDKDYYLNLRKNLFSLKFKKDFELTKYSYSKSKFDLNDDKEFSKFILDLTNLDLSKFFFEAFEFKWRDYTILNDSSLDQNKYDIIFDFTGDWNSEFGGSIVYVKEEDFIKFEPKGNTLILLKKEYNRFVQYVNNLAKSRSRY